MITWVALAVLAAALVAGAIPALADGDHSGIDNMCGHGWDCPPVHEAPEGSDEWYKRQRRWTDGYWAFIKHTGGTDTLPREHRGVKRDRTGSPAEQAAFWSHHMFDGPDARRIDAERHRCAARPAPDNCPDN